VANVDVREHEERRVSVAARVSQFVDFAFGVLYVMLVMRFALSFAGARATPFVWMLDRATRPFYAPFQGILGAQDVDGHGHVVVMSLIVAIVVYMAIHFGVHMLLRTLAVKRRTI
jgi:uncharacterized protein YggT (Ycf19 family)